MKTYFNYVSVGQKNSLLRTSFLVTYGTHTVGEVSLRALKDICYSVFPHIMIQDNIRSALR